MGLNNLTKLGYKAWSNIKSTVSDIYNPVKKIVGTVHRGAHFVDGLLNKAAEWGVPYGLVDVVRDNPIYSTIMEGVDLANDVIEKDLPRYGRAVENFVEHTVLNKIPQLNDTFNSGVQMGKKQLGEIPRRFMNDAAIAVGFTPDTGPSASQFVSGLPSS